MVNKLSKKHFGWSIEDKIKKIDPEHRYGPLIKEIMRSKEVKDGMDFYADEYWNDPLFQKVIKEGMWLKNDIFGGYDE